MVASKAHQPEWSEQRQVGTTGKMKRGPSKLPDGRPKVPGEFWEINWESASFHLLRAGVLGPRG
jgi:hypothetical protein